MIDPVKIIGSHGKRRNNDFYPTPPECTITLLNFLETHFLLKRGDRIWEPACGSGSMVDVMKQRGYHVTGTDIVYGQNFLDTNLPDTEYDWIITNPPFYAAQDFIERSAKTNKPFALLLKSQYWHSAKRRKIFQEFQPTLILPLTWRPDFTGQGAALMDMMWVVWLGKSHVTYYQLLLKPERKEQT